MSRIYLTKIESGPLVAVRAIREAARAMGLDWSLTRCANARDQVKSRGWCELGPVPADLDAGDLVAALAANGVTAALDLRAADTARLELAARYPATPEPAPPAPISEAGWRLALVLLNQAGGNAPQAAVNADAQRTAAGADSHILSEALSGLARAFPGMQAGLTKAGIKWEL